MSAELDKDPIILDVLDRLRAVLGTEAFALVDHWELDHCAIGIASPHDHSVLIYLSCNGEPAGRYGYELELPTPPDDDFPYQVVGTGSEVTYDELAQVVARHLERAKPASSEGRWKS